MLRIITGLLKGALVGAALGYGASRLGVSGGAAAYVVYGLVGAVVGLVCGRAVWRQETLWTPVLKAAFGVAIALGAAWAGRKFLGGVPLAFAPRLGLPEGTLGASPWALGPVIGVIYGIFVEVDDGGDAKRREDAKGGDAKAAAG
jgi:hypothetical protein